MEDLYVNKVKHELAQVESAKTGEDVKTIYLRMGGKVIEGEPVKEEPKKSKKK